MKQNKNCSEKSSVAWLVIGTVSMKPQTHFPRKRPTAEARGMSQFSRSCHMELGSAMTYCSEALVLVSP